MKKIIVSICSLLLVILMGLTACGPEETVLDDTAWELESYGEKGNLQAVSYDAEITLSFDGATKQVTGRAGCNNYYSEYEASGDRLSLSAIHVTEMYCETPEGIMDQEREYLALLEKTTTFIVDNGQLTISSNDGKLLIYSIKE